MNDFTYKDATGQSVIEILVILPVLILFLATIFPLLSSGTMAPWLDERLWLRQFIHEKDTLQPELGDAHSRNLIPVYFRRSDLEESTDFIKLGIAFPKTKKTYPGYMKIQKVLAKYPEEMGPFPGKGDRSDEMLTRNLTIHVSTAPDDSEIPARVRELSVSGIFPWKINALNNLHFELFHLNMEALPDAGSGT